MIEQMIPYHCTDCGEIFFKTILEPRPQAHPDCKAGK